MVTNEAPHVERDDPPRLRFTLRRLFAVTTLCAFVCGGLAWAGPTAALAAVVCCVSVALLATLIRRRRLAEVLFLGPALLGICVALVLDALAEVWK